MFEKFGEFDSAEELNAAAKGLFDEGDVDALRKLAEENGISNDEVEDYLDKYTSTLATVQTAAFGRLLVQAKSDDKNLQLKVVAMSARGMLLESEELAIAVMRKGKRLQDILSAMQKVAQKHATGTGSNRMSVCCGTDRQLEQIIETYYLEPEKLDARLEGLYDTSI